MDLKDPQAQHKVQNFRFLSRICSKEEQALIANSHSPHCELWTLWSIKEASYKAFQKTIVDLKFIPNLFICKFLHNERWRCQYAEMVCEVSVCKTTEFVHAVALYGGDSALWNKIESAVLEVENEQVASEHVRKVALELIRANGGSVDSIKRENINGILRPPKLYLNDYEVTEWDISLSHDGRFVAAACLRKTNK